MRNQNKQVSENPFYGLRKLLNAMQQLPKLVTPSKTQVYALLNDAFSEVKTITDKQAAKDARTLLFTIIFKVGDVVNRDHNVFGRKKVDNGGDSLRKTFRYCLSWMLENDSQTFYKLLPLVPEYTNFENIMFYQLTTDRYKGTLIEKEVLNIDQDILVEYLSDTLRSAKTTDFQKSLIAKFLPTVPTTKRYSRTKTGEVVAREKQGFTKEKDSVALSLIAKLSKAMGWEIVEHKRNLKYDGYCKFRSKFLALTEAHLFSTQKILDFDKVQFLEWLDSLPGGARHRVQTRICEKSKISNSLTPKEKWVSNKGFNLGAVYIEWLKSKEAALKQVLSLTEEEKKELGADKVKQLQKQAKLNTGGTTLMDSITDFLKGADETTTTLAANSIMEKVKLEVPVLCILDRSGSMSSNQYINGVYMSARNVGTLALTTFLGKNPDENLQNMFLMFGSQCDVIVDGKNEATIAGANRFTIGNRAVVDGLLYDPAKTFLQNYKHLDSITSRYREGSTNVSTIATELKRWVDSDEALKSQRIEQIQQYPVWLMISDGDLNSSYNATASMQDFQMKMLQWFGASPVIVVWDVKAAEFTGQSKFENLENVMYFGGFNYGILNQVFVNINDLDVIDIYLPLLTLFRSNRYEPVRAQLA